MEQQNKLIGADRSYQENRSDSIKFNTNFMVDVHRVFMARLDSLVRGDGAKRIYLSISCFSVNKFSKYTGCKIENVLQYAEF